VPTIESYSIVPTYRNLVHDNYELLKDMFSTLKSNPSSVFFLYITISRPDSWVKLLISQLISVRTRLNYVWQRAGSISRLFDEDDEIRCM